MYGNDGANFPLCCLCSVFFTNKIPFAHAKNFSDQPWIFLSNVFSFIPPNLQILSRCDWLAHHHRDSCIKYWMPETEWIVYLFVRCARASSQVARENNIEKDKPNQIRSEEHLGKVLLHYKIIIYRRQTCTTMLKMMCNHNNLLSSSIPLLCV